MQYCICYCVLNSFISLHCFMQFYWCVKLYKCACVFLYFTLYLMCISKSIQKRHQITKVFQGDFFFIFNVATPLWAKCESEAHTPKSGKLESSGTPKNSERDCKGQISSHLSALGVIRKLLKRKYRKWPRIGHLDI